MRIGSLFSCVGGLDLAALSVFGGEVAWHAEIDAAGTKVLAERWPGVPNLGNVSNVDFAAVEPVDLLTLGFPCTDLSLAGAGAGLGPGTRSGLWSEAARAIQVLRPQLVLIENVRGLLSARADSDVEPCPWCLGERGGDSQQPVLRALGAVLGDLAGLGFDAEWVGLPASEIGACHKRFRVFILAWPATYSTVVGRGTARRHDGVRPAGLESVATANSDGVGRERARDARHRGSGPADGGVVSTHAAIQGRGALIGHVGGNFEASIRSGKTESGRCDRPAANPNGGEVREQPVVEPRGGGAAVVGLGGSPVPGLAWGIYEPAIRRWEQLTGRPAPSPTAIGVRGGRQLSAVFVEWMQGLPEGWVTDVPGVTQNEALRLLGGMVVPQQGAAATRELLVRTAGERLRALARRTRVAPEA